MSRSRLIVSLPVPVDILIFKVFKAFRNNAIILRTDTHTRGVSTILKPVIGRLGKIMRSLLINISSVILRNTGNYKLNHVQSLSQTLE